MVIVKNAVAQGGGRPKRPGAAAAPAAAPALTPRGVPLNFEELMRGPRLRSTDAAVRCARPGVGNPHAEPVSTAAAVDALLELLHEALWALHNAGPGWLPLRRAMWLQLREYLHAGAAHAALREAAAALRADLEGELRAAKARGACVSLPPLHEVAERPRRVVEDLRALVSGRDAAADWAAWTKSPRRAMRKRGCLEAFFLQLYLELAALLYHLFCELPRVYAALQGAA